MKIEELKLKIQALVDNELPEQEIAEVMSQVEGSYDLRNEYVELLRLRRRLESTTAPERPVEWYDAVAKKTTRKIGSSVGFGLFIGSYVSLLVYAIITLFTTDKADNWVKGIVAVAVTGFLILLGITISDRIRESRNDRYKEVIR